MWRKSSVCAAVTAGALGLGGCGTGTSSGTATSYWLVRTQGTYGNIYGYPAGTTPGTSAAAYLGPTAADAHQNAPQAASRIGVKDVNSVIQ